nr:transposase [Bradyrhizobium sp. DOA1]
MSRPPTPTIEAGLAGSPRRFRQRLVRASKSPSLTRLHRRQTCNGGCRHGIALEVIKRSEAKRGFALLPSRWVVERFFAWATRFRRLIKDYERCAQTLADLHLIALVCIMLKNVANPAAGPRQLLFPLVRRSRTSYLLSANRLGISVAGNSTSTIWTAT